MELGIIIPVVIVAVIVPVAFTWAKRRYRDAPETSDEPTAVPTARLTSNALRELPSPPWRVVYEIAEDKLGGVEHVLIGPPGVFAMQTSMDPVPEHSEPAPDAVTVARAAIARGDLDDALGPCGLSSDRMVRVYWGATDQPHPAIVDVMPGVVAVDGRAITAWSERLDGEQLSVAQVDLAWQTVLRAIGRPDPLS